MRFVDKGKLYRLFLWGKEDVLQILDVFYTISSHGTEDTAKGD